MLLFTTIYSTILSIIAMHSWTGHMTALKHLVIITLVRTQNSSKSGSISSSIILKLAFFPSHRGPKATLISVSVARFAFSCLC